MHTNRTSIQKTNFILDLIAQRQQVVSTNLANVDTPGYVRKDISFSQYLGSNNSAIETDLSQRMGTAAIVSQEAGGNVDIASELVEMQKNSLLYSVASRQMSSIITQLKSVTNIGR